MKLNKFLTLIAAILGLIGAYYFGRGSLLLSPEEILDIGTTKIGYNVALLKSLQAQRTDYLFGVSFVALAFVLEVITVFIKDKPRKIVPCAWVVTTVATLILIILPASLVLCKYTIDQRGEEIQLQANDYIAKQQNR